jgi:sphinganine-1-phosphate aldolase
MASSWLSPPSSPRERLALLVAGAGGLYAAFRLADVLARRGPSALLRSLTGSLLSVARVLPGVDAGIDAALDAALAELRDEIAPPTASPLLFLPAAGKSGGGVDALIAEMRRAMEEDAEASGFDEGTSFGGIYHTVSYKDGSDSAALATRAAPAGDDGVVSSSSPKPSHPPSSLQLVQSAFACTFLNTNALYPTIFRTSRRLEAEAVAMTVNLLKGRWGGGGPGGATWGPDPAPLACGLMTSGGSESVLVAVKAHRDAALARLGYADADDGEEVVPAVVAAARDGIILSVLAGLSCHPALDKACHLFGLRLHKLRTDPVSGALAPSAVAAHLTPSTALVYVSAPGFAHGVIDPVADIASVAAAFLQSPWGKDGVPVHVDNCLGGVLTSFLVAAQNEAGAGGGALIPSFDFRAHPRVSTISCDLHKYGGAPKGSSVVAFRDPALRRFAYSATTTFPGGFYTTPALSGSKGGAAPAVAWATLVTTGAAGYAHAARVTAEVFARLVAGVAATPGLRLVGVPHACVVAFTGADGSGVSPYALAARMEERGWHLAQLQSPPALHIVVSERLAAPRGGRDGDVASCLLEDLRACAAACVRAPSDPAYEGKGSAAIYGAAGVLPAGEVAKILLRYCDTLYLAR